LLAIACAAPYDEATTTPYSENEAVDEFTTTGGVEVDDQNPEDAATSSGTIETVEYAPEVYRDFAFVLFEDKIREALKDRAGTINWMIEEALVVLTKLVDDEHHEDLPKYFKQWCMAWSIDYRETGIQLISTLAVSEGYVIEDQPETEDQPEEGEETGEVKKREIKLPIRPEDKPIPIADYSEEDMT
ncbi:hypothetical protein PMAYCL1PPCAC_09653, partial [Pristionchus mayeri]